MGGAGKCEGKLANPDLTFILVVPQAAGKVHLPPTQGARQSKVRACSPHTAVEGIMGEDRRRLIAPVWHRL
jgi:hypothetical protein